VREVVVSDFKSLRTINLMSKTKYSGRPKVYEDAELKALLNEDSCQTQKELALTLGVTQQTISYRLKIIGNDSKARELGSI